MAFAVSGTSAPDQAGCRPTIIGSLEILPLKSKVFGNTRNLRVWLPPDYKNTAKADEKFPVLYLLDGQDLFDVCTASSGKEWRVDEIMTDLIRRHSIRPAIVVGIDSLNEQQRMHEYLPYRDDVVYPNMPEPAGKLFPDFLADEVLPFITARYRAAPGPGNTALGAASYGAIAALYALLKRPDLFGEGIIESPALQSGNGQMLRDTAFLAAGPRKLFLSMGTNEVPGQPVINSGLATMFEALVRNLKVAYLSKSQIESILQPGGTHDEKSWSMLFERAVLFLYRPVQAPSVPYLR